MKHYYQKEIETASREEILKIQNEKLVKQVRYVYDNVPYYRHLMDQKGVKPEDIRSTDDIRKLQGCEGKRLVQEVCRLGGRERHHLRLRTGDVQPECDL